MPTFPLFLGMLRTSQIVLRLDCLEISYRKILESIVTIAGWGQDKRCEFICTVMQLEAKSEGGDALVGQIPRWCLLCLLPFLAQIQVTSQHQTCRVATNLHPNPLTHNSSQILVHLSARLGDTSMAAERVMVTPRQDQR